VVVLAALLGGGALYLANLPAPRTDAAIATILISIDGARPDYLERGVSPNLLGVGTSAAQARIHWSCAY
jgi:hypothetical protein